MTERTQLKRYAKRAEYDRAVVHAILDEVRPGHAACQEVWDGNIINAYHAWPPSPAWPAIL